MKKVDAPVWASSDGIPPDQIAEYLSTEECAALVDISGIINSSLPDPEEILNQSLQQLAKVLEANASSIWLINELTQRLYVASATGEKSKQVKGIDLEIGQGIAGWVVKEGKPFITDDARFEMHHARDVAKKLNFEGITMICVPMRSRDRIIGAVEALNKADRRAFNEKDLVLLSVFANLTGIALENARFYSMVQQENTVLRRELGKRRIEFQNIIGRGPKMADVFECMDLVAPTNSTVLIRGDSGTGKEMVAQSIHNASLRASKPFIAVNCAALPDALLESELFGHEKGAFTGAIARKEGRFELAHSGTLFLDEIGDMPTGLQAKVLRVLQDGEFYRVGGTHPIRCDVRIIAATNQDLDEKMKAGTFREDLYYRLNVITIFLPPLRDRVEDIPLLIEHFLTKSAAENKRKKSGFTPQALQILMNYPWPGNIRELENAIERAVVLGKTDMVEVGDLPPSLREKKQALVDYTTSLEDAQRQFKKKHIKNILFQTEGNRSKAAKILQIQRTYLSRLIKELDIDG
jgi:Nif-specific regulatory protein